MRLGSTNIESEALFFWLDADANGRYDDNDIANIQDHPARWYQRVPLNQQESIRRQIQELAKRPEIARCFETIARYFSAEEASEANPLAMFANQSILTGMVWLHPDRIQYRVLVEGEERAFEQRLEMRIPVQALPSNLLDQLLDDALLDNRAAWKVIGQHPTFMSEGSASFSIDGRDWVIAMPRPYVELWQGTGETFSIDVMGAVWKLGINTEGVTRADREVEIDDLERAIEFRKAQDRRYRNEARSNQRAIDVLYRAIEHVQQSSLTQNQKEYWTQKYWQEIEQLRQNKRWLKNLSSAPEGSFDYEAWLKEAKKKTDPVFPMPSTEYVEEISTPGYQTDPFIVTASCGCSAQACMETIESLKVQLARGERNRKTQTLTDDQERAFRMKVKKLEQTLRHYELEKRFWTRLEKEYSESDRAKLCADPRDTPRV